MAKQIRFPYDGKNYILEYTRKTVTELERKGFTATEVEAKPMTMLPALFAGAFLAHHRHVKQDVVDAIFAKMPDKEALIGKLVEMYSEPIEALLDEPAENEGNIEWTASW
jgi:hypothetical protein